MTTVREAIERTAERLKTAKIEGFRAEARWLVEVALGISASELLAALSRVLTPDEASKIESFAMRRASHEPFAYIEGYREFWSLPFHVSPATLIPRPDTETVVESALERVRAGNNPAPRILDLGTGSGCILLALLSELPYATGFGVDLNKDAVLVAQENAGSLGLASRAFFRHGRWCDGISETFDLIVSNPPYIVDSEIASLDSDVRDFEPHLALKGGADGLDAYRAIAAQAPSRLSANGTLALEVGAGQADAVADLLRGAGLEILAIRSDLAGIARCVIATRPGNQQNPGFVG
jgi:release factor glutamine methyltransferase